MKLTVQRLDSVTVLLNGSVICHFEKGILCFVGFHKNDKAGKNADVDWIGSKVVSMFYWEADDGTPWKKGIADIQGSILVVPEPGLLASVDNSDQPNFDDVMPPEAAAQAYAKLLAKIKSAYIADKVFGVPFGERVQLDFVNAGPVTISIDSFHRRD
jgi:D-tyrosyl-tRNA(Tyr) deacylase